MGRQSLLARYASSLHCSPGGMLVYQAWLVQLPGLQLPLGLTTYPRCITPSSNNGMATTVSSKPVAPVVKKTDGSSGWKPSHWAAILDLFSTHWSKRHKLKAESQNGWWSSPNFRFLKWECVTSAAPLPQRRPVNRAPEPQIASVHWLNN